MFKPLALVVACACLQAADYSALDRYIAAPDASYRYQLVATIPSSGATIYQLDLVSQNWLTVADVDRPEWHHWLSIIQPDRVTSSTAVLLINGGSNTSTPDPPNPQLVGLAAQGGAVGVQLNEVPNEPLKFSDENTARTEDAIIAYSWNKFLRTGDERWPARLPMTKAAVRAMDAATAFLSDLPSGGISIRNFIVTGASKRGWATWTTAAVDPRVIAIAPLVADVLNTQKVFVHQFRAYGFWATALQNYVDAGIMNWLGTPQLHALFEIEDPYSYRERFALPKYLINSTGDQFFLPDSSQFYFSRLPGEKYLRYIPNTDHSLAGAEATLNLTAWLQAVLQNFPRPRFYWRADRANGSLTVRVIDTPTKVLLWQATNPKARDFRLESIGPAWVSQPLSGQDGIYSITLPAPGQGFTAFFIELTYTGPADLPLVFTTEVLVAPDVYPFGPPPGARGHNLRDRHH